MFWKRKATTAPRQLTTRDMFAANLSAGLDTREEYYRRQARLVEAVARHSGASRKKQVADWFRLIKADIGETPRQIDCAQAFGLTQGRISQLMH